MTMQYRYTAKAKAWGLGETDKGTEEIAVEFEILTEGAHVERITWHGYFSDKTWERTVESLRYMGWEGNDLADVQGLDMNEVELVVEDEEYQGKVYAKVRWVNRMGGLAIKAPLTGDKAKAFAASMRDKIKALDASAPKAKPAAKKTAPRPVAAPYGNSAPAHTDDDLPF